MLPELMERSLNRFITLKLHEHGWLPKGHDDEDLRRAIISNLLEPRSMHSSGPIPAILVKEGTQIAVAEVLCTNLPKGTPLNNEKLLLFTRSLVELYHDLCFNQSVWTGALNLDFLANGVTLSSDTLTMLRISERQHRPLLHTAPLLQANRMIRDEAITIFSENNHFEISVKRSPKYDLLIGNQFSPDVVDKWMWHRFLRMWDVFNQNGSNCLHYVERITVIYQLSVATDSIFDEDRFDKRVGFRLSSKPFEEDADDDFGVVELERGSSIWAIESLRDTKFFLFKRVGRFVWDYYPIARLTNILQRCARNCPGVGNNVDFLYEPEDYQHWTTDNRGFYEFHDYESCLFYDPDQEEED